ncbi:ThiF family adenylyltransferase [Bradyrhizobium sp. NBAIM20]|uniref:ThiF family adenylyltransferase n=1 Tax=unclassified Bradyrhizobium TaxID=2631580 RepID=UPI001CD5E857|nr:ThiF family adenylyltransferase [Bradyrhizobium sp. NBAIM20]MCA1460941.1 ThiF family adenylyltransferase [Bradyrhizobium sp. NBAIM18]
MPKREATAIRRIHDAFTQRKFRRDASRSGLHYKGLLDETGLKVPVVVSVDDVDFVKPPVIRLLDAEAGSNGQIPHVLRSNGTFCYLDAKSIVLDRYKPGETIIQCLEQADKVLRDAMRGRLAGDLADEFGDYWSDGKVLVDLPLDFQGDAKIQILRFDANPDNEAILVSEGKSPYARLHQKNTGRDPDAGVLCPVIRVSSLSFDPKLPWPPKDLSGLNTWLKSMAPEALGATEAAFGRSKSGHVQWICLSAPNGRFFVSAEIAKAYRKSEFLENRRARMAKVLKRIEGAVKISGYVGVPVDGNYIFSRNLGRMKNLAGKRILLIGCGTIGGFLAQQFAQSGTGSDGGRLTLADADILQGANLGRHLLGAPYLNRNKADACAEFLREQLPQLEIKSVPDSILNTLETLHRHDLVVDATGEEALSIALNDRAVANRPNFPPMLYVWIEGNGAAAVSFMSDGPDWACLKCLRPDLSGPKRFRLVRDEADIESGRNLACGDAHFIPFPSSRAATAAGLACDMALDWANGDLRRRWRSVTMDHRKAVQIGDTNPKRLDHCPACGGSVA